MSKEDRDMLGSNASAVPHMLAPAIGVIGKKDPLGLNQFGEMKACKWNDWDDEQIAEGMVQVNDPLIMHRMDLTAKRIVEEDGIQ